jgi:hypothetical protein
MGTSPRRTAWGVDKLSGDGSHGAATVTRVILACRGAMAAGVWLVRECSDGRAGGRGTAVRRLSGEGGCENAGG